MATPIQITIDCADSAGLTKFWTQALHYVEMPPPQGAPSWAEYFRARGLPEEEVKEIEEFGASVFRVLYTEGHDYYGVVMQDPEGNEFCLS